MRPNEMSIGKRIVSAEEARRRAEDQERMMEALERRRDQEEMRRQLGPTGKEKTR